LLLYDIIGATAAGTRLRRSSDELCDLNRLFITAERHFNNRNRTHGNGGLVLGAIFMATDYVTTPNTKVGNYVYFVMLGILTAVMRRAVKGEVVSFVILLMNLVVPLFDLYIRRKPFGYVKPVKSAKEAK